MLFLILCTVAIFQKKQHRIHIKKFNTIRSVCGVNIGTQNIKINQIPGPDKIHIGNLLGMDPHADTTCVNKHAFIESIVEGMRVDAVIFDEIIGKLGDVPIVNDIYAYENSNICHTILL